MRFGGRDASGSAVPTLGVRIGVRPVCPRFSCPRFSPVKQAVSLRLDADVIAWLKKPGKGYQTRANRILRQRMLDEIRRA
jgi:uncharacterized protein (DUF4415 family)